jgi:NAD(P)-dependent dehydrogenase (short-subunit alcohol dehydrogenase family)
MSGGESDEGRRHRVHGDDRSSLEGFVRGAAAEAERGVRVNVVSPPWVTEPLVALKMDPSQGLPAATVARAYVAAVTGRANGETLDPAAFA